MSQNPNDTLPSELHLVRDLLDKLLVDSTHDPLGRADGIVVIAKDGELPRVARVELGSSVLGTRVANWIGRVIRALGMRFGLRNGRPVRIPFAKLMSVGIEVIVDTEADRSPATLWERWLGVHVTSRIPHRRKSGS
jgi:hypothetical protein